MEVPKHIKKLAELFATGKITAKDVKYTADATDATKSVFEFTLPKYDVFGDPAGTHVFAVTVESLVSVKVRLQAEVDAEIAAFDEYMTDYDALIGYLNSVKTEKEKK